MPYGITPEWIENLKLQNDIVNVIGRYIPLQKKGKNFWGRCPFHHEKTPSFAVDSYGQYYHCFGCGESGDVIKFVQKYEGVEFIEAVKILADMSGVKMPEFNFDDKIVEKKNKKDRLQKILSLTNDFYINNLKHNAVKYTSYLQKRGFSVETVKKFSIGCSKNSTELAQYLIKSGFDIQDLKDSGVIGVNNYKEAYDFLAERLIIPIFDVYNNPIAFGGRIITDNKDLAKYKNTQQTLLFEKNKVLYGLNFIRNLKSQQKIENLIIVEGYMDVIALSQAGIINSVASMGTSLTVEQAKLLKRFSDNVIICYDGDAAGQNATLRGLGILEEQGLNVKIISLPDNLDPDEFIKDKGVSAFKQLVEDAIPLKEYKLRILLKQYNLKNVYERSNFATEAIKLIRKIDNAVEQEVYLNKIKEITGFTYDSLKTQLNKNERSVNYLKEESPIEIGNEATIKKSVNFILFKLLNGDIEKDWDIIKYFLYSKQIEDIYNLISDAITQDKKITISDLYNNMENVENSAIGDILKSDFSEELSQKLYYNDCIKFLKKEYLMNKLSELKNKITQSVSVSERADYLKEYNQLSKELSILKLNV